MTERARVLNSAWLTRRLDTAGVSSFFVPCIVSSSGSGALVRTRERQITLYSTTTPFNRCDAALAKFFVIDNPSGAKYFILGFYRTRT